MMDRKTFSYVGHLQLLWYLHAFHYNEEREKRCQVNECRADEMLGFLFVMQQSLHCTVVHRIIISINIIIAVHIRLPMKMKM